MSPIGKLRSLAANPSCICNVDVGKSSFPHMVANDCFEIIVGISCVDKSAFANRVWSVAEFARQGCSNSFAAHFHWVRLSSPPPNRKFRDDGIIEISLRPSQQRPQDSPTAAPEDPESIRTGKEGKPPSD